MVFATICISILARERKLDTEYILLVLSVSDCGALKHSQRLSDDQATVSYQDNAKAELRTRYIVQ